MGKQFPREFVVESNAVEGYTGPGCDETSDFFFLCHYNSFLAMLQAVDYGRMPEPLELQAILFERNYPELIGYRQREITVDGWKPPPHKLIPVLIDGWKHALTLKGEPGRGGKARTAERHHFHFESIHPFLDGNGRVGRLLWAAHRMLWGLKPVIIRRGEREVYFDKIRKWRAENFAALLEQYL